MHANCGIQIGNAIIHLTMQVGEISRLAPRKFLPGGLLWLGGICLLLAAMLAWTLNLLVKREQTYSPVEKNLGVAVLGITFGLPITILSVTGLACLLTGIIVFVFRRMRREKRAVQ